jgi:hypothetical protein
MAIVQAIAIKVATVIARTKLVAFNTPKTTAVPGSGVLTGRAGSSPTVTLGGTGASGTNTFGTGQIPSNITVSGVGAGGNGNYLSMANSTATWANTNAKVSMQGQLTLEGENPDITIGGKSMVTWMQKVEQRLSILEPKPQLLAKYEALQQAFDHYKTLEALLHGTEDKDE